MRFGAVCVKFPPKKIDMDYFWVGAGKKIWFLDNSKWRTNHPSNSDISSIFFFLFVWALDMLYSSQEWAKNRRRRCFCESQIQLPPLYEHSMDATLFVKREKRPHSSTKNFFRSTVGQKRMCADELASYEVWTPTEKEYNPLSLLDLEKLMCRLWKPLIWGVPPTALRWDIMAQVKNVAQQANLDTRIQTSLGSL